MGTTKTFDQTFAETGRQSELDALRKDPKKYDVAKAQYEKTAGLAPTPGISTIVPTGHTVDDTGKLYGGWYDNPATGKNQRYWGNGVWTNGEEPGLPKQASDVTTYLNDYQNKLTSTSAPEVRKQLEGTAVKPAPLNREQAFANLRTDYGVSALEGSLNDLKTQEDEIVSALRQQKTAERAKPVATNVISGRIGKEERDASERLDYIVRQKNQVVDELNTKYSIIGQVMQFKGLDYQDAVKSYEDEFNRNLQIYNLVSGEKKAEETSARANLQIYMNAITSGNLDASSLSDDQKIQINKLEAKSGLPIGFVSNLKLSPKDSILFTSTDNGVTQVGVKGADGKITVQSYGTAKTTKEATAKQAQEEMATFLSSKANSYGHVSGSIYTQTRNLWVQKTGQTPDDFDKIFRAYRDPYNLAQYNLTRTEEAR